jgi:hypothetical protein
MHAYDLVSGELHVVAQLPVIAQDPSEKVRRWSSFVRLLVDPSQRCGFATVDDVFYELDISALSPGPPDARISRPPICSV